MSMIVNKTIIHVLHFDYTFGKVNNSWETVCSFIVTGRFESDTWIKFT